MDLPRLTRREAAFIIGVPLLWAVLLLFHPGGDGKHIYADLDGDGTRMLIVHVGTMIFIPLLALAAALLIRGHDSTAALVGRVGLAVFAVFYLAWEALQGIANGLLVDQVSTLPAADRALGASLIQDFAESPLARDLGVLASIGTIGLIVGMVAVGVVLRDAGAPQWAPVLLGFSGFLISGHPPPFGPTGLAIFAGFAAYVMTVEDAPAGESPATRPAPSSFTRGERVLLIGVPLAWALLLLLHPSGEGEDFYPIVSDEVTAWLTVHLATMLFVPLMAIVMLLLLRGVAGTAANVSRVALLFFAVGYLAWEVLIGIGNGILADQVNELGAGDQGIGAGIIELYADSGLLRVLELIGTGAWFVALAAAGIALVRERKVTVAVPILLILSAMPTAWHVAPFGQIGLALFIAAVILVLRSREPAPLAATQPAAA